MCPREANPKAIFLEAIENYTPDTWDAFVVEACAGDASLRNRVMLLLNSYSDPASIVAESALRQTGEGEDQDSDSNPASVDNVAGTMVGPYKLLEKIGEGGMGVVYMAAQVSPMKRKVALKIIKPGMDTKQVLARFEAERQALSMMEHPNIARVLDGGATPTGRPYFVMELVRGIPITHYCDKNKVSSQLRLQLFTDVCHAIQHAHQKGIIHRDIKPSNAMVTLHDGIPVVKVIDFGVAKALDRDLTERTLFTKFSQMIGTPLYMSPEQAEMSGLDVDTRSDIYSLGVVLYELLTGTTPLYADQLRDAAYAELQRLIADEEAPKPSTRLSTLGDVTGEIAIQRATDLRGLKQFVSGDLDWIVMKALEKDRNRRYASASSFAEDIQRFLSDEAVEARPPSTAYKLSKFVRRNRVVVTAVSIVIVTFLLGLLGTTWGLISARNEATSARAAKQEADDQRNAAIAAKRDAVAAEQVAVASESERRRELYVANMQLAGQIWSRPDGNQREIEDLLAAWIPVDDQPDLREFTWRHQWSLLHQSARQLILGNANSTFSENGNLITAGKIGIRVWNQSGKLVAHPYENDASEAELSADGRWAVLKKDKVIQLIDTSSGDVTHEMTGNRFSISSNSRFIACWQSEGDIAVWNIDSDSVSRVDSLRPTGSSTPPKHEELLLAPDGKSFVLKGYQTDWINNEVSVYWDKQSEPVRIPSGNPLGDWAWSPNGKLIASGNQMGQIRLQYSSQPEKVVVLSSHGKYMTALAFCPDSTTLVSGGADGTIEFWNVGDFNPRNSTGAKTIPGPDENDRPVSDGDLQLVFADLPPIRTIKAHVDSINSISYSPDGSEIASTDVAGVTKRWSVDHKGPIQLQDVATDLYSGTLGVGSELTEDGVIVRVVYPWGPNGRIRKGDRIVGIAEGEKATIRMVPDISDMDLYFAVLRGRPGTSVRLAIRQGDANEDIVVDMRRSSPPASYVKTTRCEFAPDGRSLAVAGFNLGASIVDTDDYETSRMPYSCMSVAYSPNGRFLAMDDHFQIAIWDLEEKRVHGSVETFRSDPSHEIYGASLAFSADSQYLAASTGGPFYHKWRKSNLYVWDVESLQEVNDAGRDPDNTSTPIHENDSIIMAVEFTPNAKSLIAADHSGAVRIWNTATWSLEKTLEFPPLTAMDISRDGSLLALGFGNWNDPNPGIVLWDLKVGARRQTLLGHRPFALAFSADGKTLASTSERHDVLLWDVATGMPLRKLEGHPTTVSGASFSMDGTKLATTDFAANLFMRDAQTFDEIDRHPLTLRALFRLGVTQNRERRYAAAEATLRHLLTVQQRTLGDDDPELVKTRAELELAIQGQSELPDRPPPG